MQPPPLALKFLRTEAGQAADIVVHRFHAWLCHRDLTLETLEPHDVRRYLGNSKRKAEAKAMSYDFKAHLGAYLAWLHIHNQLPFDPQRPVLPAAKRQRIRACECHLDRYLSEIVIARRPKSTVSVKANLKAFHRWLRARNLTLRGFARDHAVEWLGNLADRGLHAATRRARLIDVRAYLRWLAEQRKIFRDPDDLLRPGDQPKLPRYLPRPYPPQIDREIIRRLLAAGDVVSLGLVLMRQTGLRIGELLALPLDCTAEGVDGRALLKVPLGKLLSERLVPLDDETLRLIEALKRQGDAGRACLLDDGGGAYSTRYTRCKAALEQAAEGLPLAEKATTHRLRHTYATTLLNAGMSLVGVMRLLGHADYRMTLRYAAVLPETVGHEYFKAIEQIEQRYRDASGPKTAGLDTSEQLLADVIHWLSGLKSAQPSEAKRMTSLMRRLEAIKAEVESLETGRQDK